MKNDNKSLKASFIDHVLPPGVKQVTKVLNAAGFEYWLDSGTLLGIIRDGRLLPHDKDIDLGVLVEREETVKSLIPALKSLGKLRHIRYLHGKLFKLIFHPGKPIGLGLPIDINLFRRNGPHLVCPAISDRSLRREFLDKGYFLAAGWRWLIRKLIFRPGCRLEVTRPIVGAVIFHNDSWVLPTDYVLPTMQLHNLEYRIPRMVERYLEYRYGDWRTPTKNWNYRLHDGAYRRNEIPGRD